MVLALRNLLSDDLRVFAIEQVADEFHARYDACERQYKYLLAKDKNPFTRNYMGFVPNQRLALPKMQAATSYFLGSHDFSSFSRANPNIPNRICNLKELSITEYPDHYQFILKADRFLHNMVRRIVGALISISHKDLTPDVVNKWFADASPRQNLVFTTPASGLYLTKVLYNECKNSNKY
jgi:tRNA pseudouridine38-40 synthase